MLEIDHFILGALYFVDTVLLIAPAIRYRYSMKKSIVIAAFFMIINVLVLTPGPSDFLHIMLILIPFLICTCILSADKLSTSLYIFFDKHNIAFFIGLIRTSLIEIGKRQHVGITIFIMFAAVVIIVINNWKKREETYIFISWLNRLERPFFLLPFFVAIIIRALMVLEFSGHVWATYMSIVMVLLGFIISYLVRYAVRQFQKASESEKLSNENKIISNLMEMQKDQIMNYEESRNLLEIQRHDAKHHYSVLSELVKNNNLQQAQNYLDSIVENLDGGTVAKYCEHHMVNIAVSIYIKEAIKENINLSLNINVPENINVNDMELASLYANALENAVESCKKSNLPGSFIRLFSEYKNGSLYFLLENTVAGSVELNKEKMPVSKKQNGGIGTKSMKYVVDKYNGLLEFSQEGKVFKTRFILFDV